MFKSTIIFLCLSGFMTLTACGDSTPSASEIESQLAARIAVCPLMSVTDFQLINNYPQQDGTYVSQVQFNYTYTPNAEIMGYVNAFNKTYAQIQSSNDPNSQDDIQTAEETQLRNINLLIQNICPLITAQGPGTPYFRSFQDYGSTMNVPENLNLTLVPSTNGWIMQ